MDDAQLQAMMQQWRDRLAKQMDEMKVRQWCVEQTIKLCEVRAPGAESYSEIYQDVLKFITEPFADTFKPSAD